jgi:hypothetical protein
MLSLVGIGGLGLSYLYLKLHEFLESGMESLEPRTEEERRKLLQERIANIRLEKKRRAKELEEEEKKYQRELDDAFLDAEAEAIVFLEDLEEEQSLESRFRGLHQAPKMKSVMSLFNFTYYIIGTHENQIDTLVDNHLLDCMKAESCHEAWGGHCSHHAKLCETTSNRHNCLKDRILFLKVRYKVRYIMKYIQDRVEPIYKQILETSYS